MKNVDLKNLCLFVFIAFTVGACSEVNKLKSSTRQVYSEVNTTKNSLNRLKGFLGINDSSAQNGDSLANTFTPVNQKVFFNK